MPPQEVGQGQNVGLEDFDLRPGASVFYKHILFKIISRKFQILVQCLKFSKIFLSNPCKFGNSNIQYNYNYANKC